MSRYSNILLLTASQASIGFKVANQFIEDDHFIEWRHTTKPEQLRGVGIETGTKHQSYNFFLKDF